MPYYNSGLAYSIIVTIPIELLIQIYHSRYELSTGC